MQYVIETKRLCKTYGGRTCLLYTSDAADE